MRFLHRCLPYPAQCETPGTEVDARVTQEELLRGQEELAILGPEGCKVLGCFRVYLILTNGDEKKLQGPA